MRNLRLIATVLFVAVLLVGIVFLLRQTSTHNDTSVTSTSVNSQLASNDATDPPVKLSKQKISVSDLRGASSNRAAVAPAAKSVKQPAMTGKLVPASELKKSSANNRVPNGQLRANTRLNKNSSEAQQIESLEIMLRQETNPKVKAKIQHKLNSLK